ncbi:MAG: TIR domain-containing protein [Chloroflexi bacterium]|nr:TIR domain-containing protein [Chloroflexota bacterium]
MPGHYFISYSDADGRDFAQRLHDALEPGFAVWFDKHELKPGMDWDAQFRAAISACQAFLFAMTPDSVDDTCTCKNEYSDAFRFKKTIVPLKAHKDTQAPFRLNARQYIDFTGNFDAAIAKLREHLEWLKSPAGELQSLNDRLADANRDLRRADDTNRARIETDIAQLKQDIEKQTRVVENPQAEAEQTARNIRAGIERAREPEKPVGGTTRTKFINPPPMTAPRWWQDRYRENEIIRDFLRDDAMRLLTLNGRAGIGKTTLVCRLLKSLEAGQLPDDLGAMNVDGIVYLSAVGTRAINTPNLFADLCKLLPDATAHALDAIYRDPKIAPREKLPALAEKFPRGRVVVLLDNFETVLDARDGDIADAELDEALRALLDAPHHAIKLILTTRVAPRDLQLAQPARQTYLPLDEGLPVEFAIKMLREMDASGIVHLKDADDALLARAREYTRGFPRALEALYAILAAWAKRSIVWIRPPSA